MAGRADAYIYAGDALSTSVRRQERTTGNENGTAPPYYAADDSQRARAPADRPGLRPFRFVWDLITNKLITTRPYLVYGGATYVLLLKLLRLPFFVRGAAAVLRACGCCVVPAGGRNNVSGATTVKVAHQVRAHHRPLVTTILASLAASALMLHELCGEQAQTEIGTTWWLVCRSHAIRIHVGRHGPALYSHVLLSYAFFSKRGHFDFQRHVRVSAERVELLRHGAGRCGRFGADLNGSGRDKRARGVRPEITAPAGRRVDRKQLNKYPGRRPDPLTRSPQPPPKKQEHSLPPPPLRYPILLPPGPIRPDANPM